MPQGLKVTLYDLFGYLMPGAILEFALVAVLLAIEPSASANYPQLATTQDWLLFLGLAYVSGHIAQAVGNLLPLKIEAQMLDPQVGNKGLLCFAEACRKKLAQHIDQSLNDVPPDWLYRFCDTAMMTSGKIGDREVYVYREGFYRGMFVATSVFAISLACLLVRQWWFPTPEGLPLGASRIKYVYSIVLAIVAAFFLYRRFRRFGAYRVSHALLGYLTIELASTKAKSDKDSE